MIKVCGISDMHGNLGFDIEECDILCICGDIVPLQVQSYADGTFKWLRKQFIPWCEKLPCKKVFLIAGNHDIHAQRHPDDWENAFKDTKIEYLLDKSATYTKDDKTITIYGTPWCHQFYDWAFMTSDDILAEIYDKIPENVDILMTHDSPYGTSDILLQRLPWSNDGHIGCKPLGDAVDIKKPRIMLHGHLHSTNHEMEKRNDTEVYNVSMLDESYNLVYYPLYFEI